MTQKAKPGNWWSKRDTELAPPKRKAKRAPTPEDITRPPGWYMQPVRRASAENHAGWPPRFEPRFDFDAHALQAMRADFGRVAGLANRQETPVQLPGSRTDGRAAYLHRAAGARDSLSRPAATGNDWGGL